MDSATFSSIDPNDLTLRDPSKIEHGFLLNTSGTFHESSFQLPPMEVKFDPNTSDSGAVKLSIAVTDATLVGWLKKIDSRVISLLVENSEPWFKKPLTEAVVADKYAGILNAKNANFDPLMKLKLNDKSKRTPTDIYRLRKDSKSVEQCTVADVRKGDTVTAIVRLTGLFSGSTGMFPQITVDEMLVEREDIVAAPYASVEPASIQYTAPKKMDNGGDIVFVQDRQVFAPPDRMLIKFNVDEPEKEGQGKKATFELDDDTFAQWVKSVDQHNIDMIMAHSEEWCGAAIPREVAESRYKPLFLHKNPSYSPLLKMRIRDNTRKYPTAIHVCDPTTQELAPADDSVIVRGARATVAASFMGMYIINKKQFYPAVDIVSMTIYPNEGYDPNQGQMSLPARVYSEIDLSDIRYSDTVKTTGDVGMIYTQGNAMPIILPEMLLKFDQPEREGQCKKISLEVGDVAMGEWLKQVDRHNVDMLVKNSEELFKRPIEQGIMEGKYRGLYRKNNPNFDPLMTVRVRGADKTSPTALFMTQEDGAGDEIPCDEHMLKTGVMVSATVSLMGMCIRDKQIFPLVNAVKLVIRSNSNKRRRFNWQQLGLSMENKPETTIDTTPLTSSTLITSE
jgi:hypothetical protein